MPPIDRIPDTDGKGILLRSRALRLAIAGVGAGAGGYERRSGGLTAVVLADPTRHPCPHPSPPRSVWACQTGKIQLY